MGLDKLHGLFPEPKCAHAPLARLALAAAAILAAACAQGETTPAVDVRLDPVPDDGWDFSDGPDFPDLPDPSPDDGGEIMPDPFSDPDETPEIFDTDDAPGEDLDATDDGLDVDDAVDAADDAGDISEDEGPCLGVLYRETFDSSNGGFTSGGTRSSWNWGTATAGPGGCRGGTGFCWSTNPSGNYNRCEDSWVVSPEIDLSACAGTTATLRFTYWHWYDFEGSGADCIDGLAVEFSNDGGASWHQLTPEGGWSSSLNVPTSACIWWVDMFFNPRAGSLAGFDCYGTENTWEQASFILPTASLSARTLIRFVFGSDYTNHFAGYVFDDLEIIGE